MARFLKNRSASLGKVPGELIFMGDKKVEESTMNFMDYNTENLYEKETQVISDRFELKDTNTVSWLNIIGLHDLELIRNIGKQFNLHSLTLEDILNTGQRPKMEDYDSYLFFTLNMMSYDEEKKIVKSEQLSLILGDTFLLTFQERLGDVFDPVRDRIRKNKGRIRNTGIDYLAYSLLDTIVDNYIFIIERLGEEIEDNEELILENPTQEVLNKINTYKRELNYLRKSIRPAREFIQQLSRFDSEMIQESTIPFIKDLLDLSTQAVEIIDTYRDMLSDQLEIYNTIVNNRLNEIMKTLTIFSAVFIPLTFIAGIYGTNFKYLPELEYHYSYFIFWGVLIAVGLTMFSFFKKKKWM